MQCTLWEFITNETEYRARDDLYRLVSFTPGSLVRPDGKRQLWEVAAGLAYLHEMKVVHGDINGVCACSS
jgi:serine/threonine protein kinase